MMEGQTSMRWSDVRFQKDKRPQHCASKHLLWALCLHRRLLEVELFG